MACEPGLVAKGEMIGCLDPAGDLDGAVATWVQDQIAWIESKFGSFCPSPCTLVREYDHGVADSSDDCPKGQVEVWFTFKLVCEASE